MLTCAAVQPPPHRNTEAEIRPLASDDDWRAVASSWASAATATAGPTWSGGPGRRRRLTQAGRAAWFGAFTGGRLLAQLGVCDAGGGLARYQDVETEPATNRRAWPGRWSGRRPCAPGQALGASTLVIIWPIWAEEAIRIYRTAGPSRRTRPSSASSGQAGWGPRRRSLSLTSSVTSAGFTSPTG